MPFEYDNVIVAQAAFYKLLRTVQKLQKAPKTYLAVKTKVFDLNVSDRIRVCNF